MSGGAGPSRKFLPRKIAPGRRYILENQFFGEDVNPDDQKKVYSAKDILERNRKYLQHLKDCKSKNEKHLLELQQKEEEAGKQDREIKQEINLTKEHLGKIHDLITHCLKKLHDNCCGKSDREPRHIDKEENGDFVCWDCKTKVDFRVRRSERSKRPKLEK